jgi:hypothetical protein
LLLKGRGYALFSLKFISGLKDNGVSIFIYLFFLFKETSLLYWVCFFLKRIVFSEI